MSESSAMQATGEVKGEGEAVEEQGESDSESESDGVRVGEDESIGIMNVESEIK